MSEPFLPRDKSLRPLSTNLRMNATKEERRLWYNFLRTYPLRFNRQRIIGEYIVDFYCAKAKLAVELDGSQHYEEAALAYDRARTAYLEHNGITVLRFTNLEVLRNFDAVCSAIDARVKECID